MACSLLIATAEIDNNGFEAVLTLGDITRHVQLKCLKVGGKRGLAEKMSEARATGSHATRGKGQVGCRRSH